MVDDPHLVVSGIIQLFPRKRPDLLEVETGRGSEPPSRVSGGVSKYNHLRRGMESICRLVR